MDIGIIGLGLLGHALAQRFVKRGDSVFGSDTSEEAMQRARATGVHVDSGLEGIASNCGVILLSLPDSTARQRLLWDEQHLAAMLPPETLLLDTTTGRPTDTESDHARLHARNVRLVDVCVLGSSQEARSGQAMALIGAPEREEMIDNIVAAFAEKRYYTGPPGNGARMKLVVNLVLGLNRLVLAEGLGLAEMQGLDLELVLEVLRGGAAYSRVMDTKGQRMLQRDYAPAARLAQHAKDVGLILELAEQCGARSPLSEVHASVLAEAQAAGLGELDNAAIAELFRKHAPAD